MPASPQPASINGRRPLRNLLGGVLIFNLMGIGLISWILAQSHHRYVVHSEATTHTLALVLDQDLTATVRQIDLILLAVKDEAVRAGAGPRGEGIDSHIHAWFPRMPLLETLGTVDAKGRLDHLGGTLPGPDAGLPERPFFRDLKDTPRAGLYVSRPSRDGAGKAWVITFARRLAGQNGHFRGVVFATVTLDKLTRDLAQVDVGRHGSISLRGKDLELLARYPAPSGQHVAIGDSAITGDYAQSVDLNRDVNHFTARSVLDRQIRTYTFRKTAQPVFYILVGLSQEDYLASWRHEVLVSAYAAAGLALLSLALAWIVRSGWDRQLRAHAERDRLIQALTAALAEVKALSGLLPICSQCKKVRDDHGYWNQIETYISTHSEATFTHGLCPDCAKGFRDEILARRPQKHGEEAK